MFLEYPPVGLNATSSNGRIIRAVLLESCQDGSHVVLALLHGRLGSRSIIRRLALESGEDGGDVVLALLCVWLDRRLSSCGVVRRLGLKSREDGRDVVITLHSTLSGRGIFRRLALKSGDDGSHVVLALLCVWLNSVLSRGGVLQYRKLVEMVPDDEKNAIINTYLRALTLESSKDAGDIVVTASKTLRGFRVL